MTKLQHVTVGSAGILVVLGLDVQGSSRAEGGGLSSWVLLLILGVTSGRQLTHCASVASSVT